MLELAAEQELPVYFLGAAEGVAEEAARRQTERFPGLRVAGTHHGYFTAADEAGVVQAVRESGARILLVAMGAPRQEVLLRRNRDRLGVAVGLGVGGSFDVWAGTVKRAPAWTQRARVEWLYRLARDPRRLRRQLVLPRYAVQVIRWSPDDYGPPRRRRAAAGEADGGQKGSGRSGRRRPDGRRRLRYLISGYYGEKNAGDEAILAGILQEIGRRDPDARFTVLSFDPEDTERRHGEGRELEAISTSLRAQAFFGRS